MIKKHGKIIEATEEELFDYWLNEDICEIMSFEKWVDKLVKEGTFVIKYERED